MNKVSSSYGSEHVSNYSLNSYKKHKALTFTND